jgi:arginase
MIGIIGCPYDENSSFMRGTAEAPPLMRAALFSDAANLWTENGTNLGIEARIEDAGDLPTASAADMNLRIDEGITALLDRGLKPIALGGDHSISYPVVRAVVRKHHQLTVIHFDAHPDLYEEFQGNRFSHACPFARIMEEGLAKRLVQVGIRTATGHQRDQARRFGVEMIEMKDWRDALPDCESPVYISFDLDALDPAFAPGVVHREPGGLSVRQAIHAIQSLRANLVGADIVEFNPHLDPQHMTGAVCSKLLKEIAAKMLE